MNIKPLADRYRTGNREAAGVILEDVARYGGESGLLVQVARLTCETPHRDARLGQPDRGDSFELVPDGGAEQPGRRGTGGPSNLPDPYGLPYVARS